MNACVHPSRNSACCSFNSKVSGFSSWISTKEWLLQYSPLRWKRFNLRWLSHKLDDSQTLEAQCFLSRNISSTNRYQLQRWFDAAWMSVASNWQTPRLSGVCPFRGVCQITPITRSFELHYVIWSTAISKFSARLNLAPAAPSTRIALRLGTSL